MNKRHREENKWLSLPDHFKTVHCNLCGSNQYSVIYKTYEGDIVNVTFSPDAYKITDHHPNLPLRIVKCHQCGLIYTNPMISEEILIDNYIHSIDEDYLKEETGRRLSARLILKELQRLKKTGKLLDIGCATGFLLDEARQCGFEPYGVELSTWAVNHARNQLKLTHITQSSLEEAAYPSRFFDIVVLKDAIEHLTDPKGTLVEIRRLLKPDGIICVNTPNISSLISRLLRAKWWGIKQTHLFYFTRKSLNLMLKEAGFLPIKTKTHTRVFSVHYLLSKMKSYSTSLYKIGAFFSTCCFKPDRLVTINFRDQIEVYAQKKRQLDDLEEIENDASHQDPKPAKVIAVLPAYNAEKTLKKTVADIPKETVNEIILVDDASRDQTVKIAHDLKLTVFRHEKNRGYGANQKTCFTKALEAYADIVVMVHPDYQYDPKVIPQLIDPIKQGKADAVFGSRMMKGGALEGGMPRWKHNANIFLTALENIVFGTYLTEYHSGFRAYSAKALKSIPFLRNQDGFIFDTEIIAQLLLHHYKIEEIPIQTRYFDEASSIRFWPSVLYGFGILKMLVKYTLHKNNVIKFDQLT